MKYFSWYPLILLAFASLSRCNPSSRQAEGYITDPHGAVVRMDTTTKCIYLVFTAHDFAEGFPNVREVLVTHDIQASFFFTGDFYRNIQYKGLIDTLLLEGHYLGAHSDKHLLYCDWGKRDSLLVTKDEFTADVLNNYQEMQRFGISKEDAMYYMPPYEWYNLQISEWTRDLGLILFNFSGGTSSNQDWTYPELGTAYISSDSIYHRILRYESKYGMNGFILLTHIGTDPRRTDKFYYRFNELIEFLLTEGYSFCRLE